MVIDHAVPAKTTAPIVRPKLTWGTKFTYGFGDLASQLIWTTTGSYLALFYTDAVGLSAAAVSVLMLVARVLDAVIDPAIGAAAERTRSRFGRFRSWLIYGSPVLAVLMVLSFTTIPGSDVAKFIYAVVSYGLLGIAYSAVNVPYGALVGVMTADQQERVTLNSVRMIGTNIGVVLLSALTLPLILTFSGTGHNETGTVQGYTWTAVVMSVIALPMFLAVAFKSKELVRPVASTRVPIRKTIHVVVGNRPLMLIFLMMLLSMTGFFGRLGIVVYYYIYAVGRIDLVSVFMAAPAIAGAVGIALFTPLTRRYSKRLIACMSLVAQGLSLIAVYVIGPTNVTGTIVALVIYGLVSFNGPIIWSMVPDAIDYAEERSGVRADGTSYAVISFAQKVGNAIGGAAGVAAIGALGYVANAHQSPEAINGMNLVSNLVPAFFAFAAIIPFFFYKLSDAQNHDIRERLDTASLQPEK
ncbi:MFS transporter [Arthrobacter bambusae]